MPIEPKRAVKDIGAYQRPQEGRHHLVRLDFNENTEGYPSFYPGGLPHVMVSAYPEYEDFTNRLATFYKTDADMLLLTNGSDEGLSVIAQTFVEPGDCSAVVSLPCFSMIPHCLKIAGASLHEVAVLPDLSFNLAGLEKELSNGASIAIFATPENPTGAVLDTSVIARWTKEFPDCLFVIDEAYGEFGGTTALPLVPERDNLLVLKTFSKAWGMAGLRLGIVFGQPYLLEFLNRVRLPYSVNSAAVWTADQLLQHSEKISGLIKECMTRKDELANALRKRGYRIDLGASNSLLFGAGLNAQRFTDFCKQSGVLVRNRSKEPFVLDLLDCSTAGGAEPDGLTVSSKKNEGSVSTLQNEVAVSPLRSPMWGKVRISVGTNEEHQRLLTALDSFQSSYGVLFDLDGTLVDTSKSFDAVVSELVLRHSGRTLPPSELAALREEGGYNDDWVATRELLHRRGFELPMSQIAAEALALYLELAPKTEELLMELELLDRLRQRHPVFIVTGRSRAEYEPIWGDRLTARFDKIYCLDDIAGHAPKPAPDYLLQALRDHELQGGVYIGNSVDDMWAARDAGLDRIALTSSLSEAALKNAGAQIVISSMTQLIEIFML